MTTKKLSIGNYRPREVNEPEVQRQFERAVRAYAAMHDPIRQILWAYPWPESVYDFTQAIEWLIVNTTFDVEAINAEKRRIGLGTETDGDTRKMWVTNITLAAERLIRDEDLAGWHADQPGWNLAWALDYLPISPVEQGRDDKGDTRYWYRPSSTRTWPLFSRAVRVQMLLLRNALGTDYTRIMLAKVYVDGAVTVLADQLSSLAPAGVNEYDRRVCETAEEAAAYWRLNIERAAERLLESERATA
jgi:hypothetical protein